MYLRIDSSASEYTTLINSAVNSWVHTTDILVTPISLASTTNKSSSYFDIYETSMPGSSNTVAGTYIYVKNVGCINPGFIAPNQNYSWTEIVLNSDVFPYLQSRVYNGLTGDQNRQGTIAHEFGHAMGLAHSNSNPDVIMCQLGYDRRVYTPMEDDLAGINYLYE